MERPAMQVIVDIIYRLRAGQSLRAIHRDTGHSRDTLRQYRRLAQEHGFLDRHRPLPEPAQVEAALAPLLAPPRTVASPPAEGGSLQCLARLGLHSASSTPGGSWRV